MTIDDPINLTCDLWTQNQSALRDTKRLFVKFQVILIIDSCFIKLT